LREDAGTYGTSSNNPVYTGMPVLTSDTSFSTLRFRSSYSTMQNVYYKALADSAFISYEPAFVTERGSKVTSVGTTEASIKVARTIGMPTFQFAYADTTIGTGTEQYTMGVGESKVFGGVTVRVNAIDATGGISCVDGTAHGSCSSSKPKMCTDGVLVVNVTSCGCPAGQIVNGTSCITWETALNSTLVLNLSSGWSIISFHITPTNNSTASVFAPVVGSVNGVWGYENGIWSDYKPGIGGNLTEIKDGRAYFVNANASVLFPVNGTQQKLIQNPPPQFPNPPFRIQVYAGWNLLGVYTSVANPTIGYVTSGLPGEFYTYYSPTLMSNKQYFLANGSTTVQHGNGFWMYSLYNASYSPKVD